MTADVELLRERLQDYADGLGSPPVILHDVGELVTLLREADAEIEALRAEVEEARRIAIEHADARAFADDRANMAEAHAERLAEALREAADMLLADYPETAKRLRDTLHPTAAQEDSRE